MIETEVLPEVRACLSMIWHDPEPTEAKLRFALDRLLALSHRTSAPEPDNHAPDPPSENYDALRARASQRYGQLGLYSIVDPLTIPSPPLMVGDAIDDIADIVADLQQAVWLWDNVSIAEGLWFLNLMLFHWSGHARQLANYLHARHFG